MTVRRVTYWTKFEPSRLGQREGGGGGGSRVAKIAPQVMYRSSSFRRFRANYEMCRGFRPHSILWFLECSLKVILFALSHPSDVLLVFSYLLFFWPE